MEGTAKGARKDSAVTAGGRRGREEVLCFGGKSNTEDSDYNH